MNDKFLTCAARILLVFSLLTLTFGCSKRYHDLPAFSALPLGDPENQSVGRFKTTYLADQIDAYFRGNVNAPIAVATFVDIDNLYSASTFGRILSEQLMSELTMRGYNVIEMRQSEVMQFSYREGELGLSRDVGMLKPEHNVSAIVVGTYAVSPVRVYINARILDPKSSAVTSAGSVEMSKSDEIAKLLRSRAYPSTLERMPVRQLGYSFVPEAGRPAGWTPQPSYPQQDSFVVPRSNAPQKRSETVINPTLEPTS